MTSINIITDFWLGQKNMSYQSNTFRQNKVTRKEGYFKQVSGNNRLCSNFVKKLQIVIPKKKASIGWMLIVFGTRSMTVWITKWRFSLAMGPN